MRCAGYGNSRPKDFNPQYRQDLIKALVQMGAVKLRLPAEMIERFNHNKELIYQDKSFEAPVMTVTATTAIGSQRSYRVPSRLLIR